MKLQKKCLSILLLSSLLQSVLENEHHNRAHDHDNRAPIAVQPEHLEEALALPVIQDAAAPLSPTFRTVSKLFSPLPNGGYFKTLLSIAQTIDQDTERGKPYEHAFKTWVIFFLRGETLKALNILNHPVHVQEAWRKIEATYQLRKQVPLAHIHPGLPRYSLNALLAANQSNILKKPLAQEKQPRPERPEWLEKIIALKNQP